MKLSIVIVNWKVCDLLRECLESVYRETKLPGDQFEVIVVDNDSRDGSVEMLAARFPQVISIASAVNLGFAPGCQLGYAQSHGQLVLLLNPDTVILDGAIDKMVARMDASPEIGIVGSRLLNGDGSFQRAAGGAFPSLGNIAWNYLFLAKLLPKSWAPKPVFIDEDLPGVRDIDWVSGASLMFRREAVGPRIFHPNFFMFGEDMDLCDRVKREGWRVCFSAEQSITHYHGRSYNKQAEREVLATVYKGPRQFFARTHGPLALFAYDLMLFIGYALRWMASALLSMVRPGKGFAEMRKFCGTFLRVMLKTRFQRSG